MAHFRFGGIKIPEDLRIEHATVIRDMPDGTRKYLFPIYDRITAERALENINSSKPPLFNDELKAVIDRAMHYISGRPAGKRNGK